MTMTLLTACKKSETNDSSVKSNKDVSTSGGETKGSKYQTTYGSKVFDNVTITVELFDRSNAPEGSTITDNKWVNYVKEKMSKVGINVEFVTVPRFDEVPKMQTMMASGTAPDITLTYTYSYAQDYFKDGGVWDLTEFISGDDQVVNLKKYLGQDVLDIGKMPTGEYYGIVAKRATTAQTNLFIRKDLLDEQGLQVPTTADELFDVVAKIKSKHPDHVGMSLFGLGDLANSVAYRNQIALSFSQLVNDRKELDIADGFDYYYDPGNREYFRWVNKAYNAGLIDQEFYAMSNDDFVSDIVNGKQIFFESNVNYNVDPLRGSVLQSLKQNVPGADIISIPTLKNVNDGKQYTSTYAKGGLVAFFPKTASAEKVEAGLTYLDWLASEEGGFAIFHGFEGEHFEFNENRVPIVKDAEYNTKDKDWIRTDLFLVGNMGYFMTVEDFNASAAAELPGYEKYVAENYKNALLGTLIPNTTYTSPSTPEIRTDLALLCSEYLVKVITSPEAEFDKTYDEFLKACEVANIKTIIDERTEYFTQVYGR